MSRKISKGQLAIELTTDEILVFGRTGETHRRTHRLRVSGEKHENSESDEEAAEWLRECAASSSPNMNPKATVYIPRSVCWVHQFIVSSTVGDQLPGMVALEVESQFGDAAETQTWDFIAEPMTSTGELLVVVYVVGKNYLQRVSELMAAAAVEVTRVTLVEFELAAIGKQAGSEVRNRVVVQRKRVYLLVDYQNVVLQSHTLSIENGEKVSIHQCRGILRRLVASLPEALQSSPMFRQIVVDPTSEASEATEEFIAEAVDQEFQLVEPSDATKRSAIRDINFVSPTREKTPFIGSRVRFALAASIFLLAAAGLFAWTHYKKREFEKLSSSIRSESREIQEQLKALSPKLSAVEALDRWNAMNVRWDDRLKSLSKVLKDSEDVYLTHLQSDRASRDGERASIRLEGRAKTPDHVLTLTRKIVEQDPSQSVQPNGIHPSRVDSEFGSQFRILVRHEDSNRLLSVPQDEQGEIK